MAVVLTVTAPGPAALAELWARLGGHHAQVDIVGDDISIHVDLTPPGAADDLEPEEDLVDQLAPIEDDDDPEPHEQAEDIAEPEPDADVVAIDRKARDKHPAGKATDGPTCAEAILAIFNAEPAIEFSIMDVVDSIDGHKESTVKFTIAQLLRNNQIQRVGRGMYQAAAR